MLSNVINRHYALLFVYSLHFLLSFYVIADIINKT